MEKYEKTAERQRRLYPIPEARQQLGGISNGTFYALVKAGVIKLVKIGRRSFVSEAGIDEAVAKLSKR